MRSKMFTINSKRYIAKEIDFNALCDLEDEGLSLSDIQNKPMSAVRAYFTICFGGDKEAAGKEIENHIIGGGSLEELSSVFLEEFQKSDFFRALTQNKNEETQENETESTT